MNDNLPAYTSAAAKQKLITQGCSGTVYSLVMPESEKRLCEVVDGGDRNAASSDRDRFFLDMYREPWTQKQDAAHEEYFDHWFNWSSSRVNIERDAFPHHYPTAGASEGIFKLMSEYAARCRADGYEPVIHLFDGDYEGYPAFANSLNAKVVRHRREDWRLVSGRMGDYDQFWISLPSAIDGEVWEHWPEFLLLMQQQAPTTEVIPDLTYVGAVAAEYVIDVMADNIPAVVFSHSKPMGGYYHRVGGVVAREERPSLFGNRWFKNLLSLRWGCEMMRNYKVNELPSKYRLAQEMAAQRVGERLGINLKPAGVMLLATADPKEAGDDPVLKSLIRGTGGEARIRLCVTPEMDRIIKAQN